MVDHPFRTAAAAENGVYEDTLLEAGVKRTILVLAVDEDLGDYEFDTGEIPLAVAWALTGFVYYYDSTDSTTPDDGLTTLVTGNGLRYAIEDAASISLNAVLDEVTAPSGSETVGDAYIVAAAATDEFAGQDDNLAFLTRRGWVFAVPEIGQTVLNRAAGTNTQFTDTGWSAMAVEFADGSIPPVALQFPGGIVVENTLDAPPGSPSTGKFWIVGSSPSGAFVGHAADLAYWTGSAWAFMDPADGWTAFHKTFGFEVFYISGAWLGSTGSEVQTFSTAGGATWTKPSKGNMALIECWGSGGSGARTSVASTRGGGGGSGGAYRFRYVLMSALPSSVSVTVAAGGVSVTSGTTVGNDGAASSFGSFLSAFGGAGGGSGANGAGASGGGMFAAGVNAGTGSTGAAAPGFTAGAGGNGASGSPTAGGTGTDGGGGGGGGNGGSGNGGAGGASLNGGGGGGGSAGSGTGGAGGASTGGGAGGAGANGGGNGAAGSQPGGGGGGASIGNSGKGGDGRVRVTVF